MAEDEPKPTAKPVYTIEPNASEAEFQRILGLMREELSGVIGDLVMRC